MTKTRMPKHIQDALIADGTMTEGFLTRTARTRHCPTCHTLVLAAIDDLGTDAWCDPQLLTPLGELQATMAGRRTWSHTMGGLDARDAPYIRRFPADRLEIHAQHVCGAPPLDSRPPPPSLSTSKPDTPPF